MSALLALRLDAFLEAKAGRGFDWRDHNCATFCADWVLEATGRDVLGEWRGRMTSTRAALRELRRVGGYEAAAARALGAHVAGRYACAGDVVLFRSRVSLRSPVARSYTGFAWGICTGSRVAGVGWRGVVLLPMDCAEVAWRVG